jgi:molybdopterin/thiamine biosynthesis adenylyltransferase
VVGAGGIGVYAATALAAIRQKLVLIDDDFVEPSNLNRQGLFTSADANSATRKAEAASRTLGRFYSRTDIAARIERVTVDSSASIFEFDPAVIVSAVDNAETRLLLSRLASSMQVPLVHAGTDIFSADCYVQSPGGPSLDEQMNGALYAAALSESARAPGGCAANPSYVVPAMIAGAFAAARVLELTAEIRALQSLHWRSGMLPRCRSGDLS